MSDDEPLHPNRHTKLLLVLEGANDIEFLRRLAKQLHREDEGVPDLNEYIASGSLVILTAGGGDPIACAHRLLPLGLPQFHLYDREQQPQTVLRIASVTAINQLPECEAVLLAKRALENYLHPAAIVAAGEQELDFGDEDCVARLLARARYHRMERVDSWDELPVRSQQRYLHRTKRWLNRSAVEHMTAALLAQRDPDHELLGFLHRIATLASR